VIAGIRLKLPATSANIGPGFDALGLAMGLELVVEARVAREFSITATGRDADVVGDLARNLMIETYQALMPAGPALKLRVSNGIPLGMGCGSSAAALLSGVMLANWFGMLEMPEEAEVLEACVREGHPDNVAACFYGGMTASSMRDGRVSAATVGLDGEAARWRLLLVLPRLGLATKVARGLLPEIYNRADVIQNIQATALLMAAFSEGRPDLLEEGTRDRVHQPYRMGVCPLLERLLPLVGTAGIWSVTLSGAGPAVLLICDPAGDLGEVFGVVRGAAGQNVEILETRMAGGASVEVMKERA